MGLIYNCDTKNGGIKAFQDATRQKRINLKKKKKSISRKKIGKVLSTSNKFKLIKLGYTLRK